MVTRIYSAPAALSTPSMNKYPPLYISSDKKRPEFQHLEEHGVGRKCLMISDTEMHGICNGRL